MGPGQLVHFAFTVRMLQLWLLLDSGAAVTQAGTAVPPMAAPGVCALQKYVVTLADDASPSERWAATELLPILQQLACPAPATAPTCLGPALATAAAARGKPQFAVGHGAAVLLGLPAAVLIDMGATLPARHHSCCAAVDSLSIPAAAPQTMARLLKRDE